MFKIIDTYEQAVPLSEAGLLWYKVGSSEWETDPVGYWGGHEPYVWERLLDLEYVHAILLEE